MGALRRLLAAVDALGFCGAAVGAVACLLLAAMLVAEVVLTSLFQTSQPWAVEYGNYFLAFVLFCGAGWSVRTGDHIRVAFLAKALPPRGVRLLETAVTALAVGISGFCATALVGYAWRTAQLGSRSYFPLQTPLVYPQAVIAAAFVLLTLGLFLLVINAALLGITAAVTDRLTVNGFVAALLGGLVLAIGGWIADQLLDR